MKTLCSTFYRTLLKTCIRSSGTSTEETMSRDTRLSMLPIESVLKFRSPLSLLLIIQSLRFRSYRHRYEIMGIPIKHQPKRSTYNIPQIHRQAKRQKMRIVIQHSVYRSRRRKRRRQSLSLSWKTKSKSSKRGLKGLKLRVLAMDRERWIVSPSPTPMSSVILVFPFLSPSLSLFASSLFPPPSPFFPHREIRLRDSRDKKIAASYPSKRYFCIRFVLQAHRRTELMLPRTRKNFRDDACAR